MQKPCVFLCACENMICQSYDRSRATASPAHTANCRDMEHGWWKLSIVCCLSHTPAWECGWERLYFRRQTLSTPQVNEKGQICHVLDVMAQNLSQPVLKSVYEVSWTRRWRRGRNPVAFIEAFLLWLVYFLKWKLVCNIVLRSRGRPLTIKF